MPAAIENLIVLLVSLAALFFVHSQMKKDMDSREVVAFEFLRTEAATNALLNSPEWQQPVEVGNHSLSKLDRLERHTIWDFHYIVTYFFSLLCFAALFLERGNRHLQRICCILLIMAISDVVENMVILLILNGGRGIWPGVMFVLASAKFGMLALYLRRLVVGVVQRVKGKL